MMVPSITSGEELASKTETQQHNNNELEEAQNSNLLHCGRVGFKRSDLLASSNLLIACFLLLHPGIMQGLLLVAVLLIALLDMTNQLMRPFAFKVLTRTQGKACLRICSTPFCPECWGPRLYRWNHRHNAEEVHRQLILQSRTY